MAPKNQPKSSASRPASGVEMPDDLAHSQASTGPVFEADFDAPTGQPSSSLTASIQSADGPDTVTPHADLFAARDELLSRLGGMTGIASAQSTARPDIVGAENIVGVGVGFRFAGNSLTADVVVKVFVDKKLPLAALTQASRIPKEIGGVGTDVEDIGQVVPQSWTSRQPRPVKCGVSAGHVRLPGSGTLGCVVILNNGKLAILSNSHIFALENSVVSSPAQVGDRIIQPAPGERVPANDEGIGLLEAFVPLQSQGNTVDGAVAWTNSSRVSPTHMTYALNPTPMRAALGMTVMKNGRTTESTLGVVTDTGFSVNVGYRDFPQGAGFVNQLVIRGVGPSPFSMGGDSGSLIVTAGTKQPVALLFAGPRDNSVTFANPISEVIAKLGIREFVAG